VEKKPVYSLAEICLFCIRLENTLIKGKKIGTKGKIFLKNGKVGKFFRRLPFPRLLFLTGNGIIRVL